MPIEKQFIIHTGQTAYRLRPNPDAPVEDGFKSGAVLEYSDDDKLEKWEGHFYIAPEAFASMAELFKEISNAG